MLLPASETKHKKNAQSCRVDLKRGHHQVSLVIIITIIIIVIIITKTIFMNIKTNFDFTSKHPRKYV